MKLRRRHGIGLLVLILLSTAWLIWRCADAPTRASRREREAGLEEPDAPLLRARGRARSGRSADDEEDGREPDEPQETSSGTTAVRCWIEVHVECAGVGENEDWARAYVLAPGAQGATSASRVPHAAVAINGEPERIPLLAGGVYDVGCVCDFGSVVVPDVVVREDEVLALRLVLPTPEVVRVRLLEPWPIREMPEAHGRVDLIPPRLVAGRPAPGRGETLEPLCSCALWTHVQGVRVPANVPFQPRVVLVRPRAESATEVYRFDALLPGKRVEPAKVRGGDEVKVRLPRLHPVRVRVTFDQTSWPPDERSDLEIRLEGRGWSVRYYHYRDLHGSDPPAVLREAIDLLAPEGHFRVAWDGRQIEAGTLGPFEVDAVRDDPIEVPIRYDTARLATLDSIPIQVRADGEWFVGVAFAWGPGHDDVVRVPIWNRSEPSRAPASWRRDCAFALGWAEPDRVTPVASVPVSGSLDLAFVPGGFVRVRCSDAYPLGLGSLTLRRLDGVPIVHGRGRASLDVRLGDRQLLGPFAPGTYSFRVSLGREKLEDVALDIRAGEECALDLRSR